MPDLPLFSFFVLLIVRTVPVGYALGIAATLWTVLDGTAPLIMIPQRKCAGIDGFPLIAAAGGISDRLSGWRRSWWECSRAGWRVRQRQREGGCDRIRKAVSIVRGTSG